MVGYGVDLTGAPAGVPSTENCTDVIAAPPAATAWTVVGPLIDEPSLGEVITTPGRVGVGVTCCRTVTVVPGICNCVSVTVWLGPDWAK